MTTRTKRKVATKKKSSTRKTLTKRLPLRNRTPAPKNKDRSSDVVFSIVALVVVFGSLLGIVVVQTFIVQNRVKLDGVHADLSVERERNQQLRLTVIELEAPKRILDTATTRLGMVRPEQRAYLPGVDPNLVAIRLPPIGNPFGPAPLTETIFDTTPPTTVASEPTVEALTTDEAGEQP